MSKRKATLFQEHFTNPQNHKQCKNYSKTFDQLEIILEFFVYELRQKISQNDLQNIQQTSQDEIQNYQRIIKKLKQGQYEEICQDIQYLKIHYTYLNKQSNQNKRIDFWLSQGIELIKEQNWDKAFQYFEQILKHQQQNSYAQFYLSVVLLELNQCYKSQRMFNKLKKNYPRFYEEAIQKTNKQLKIAGDNLAELLFFGHLLFENNQYFETLKSFEEAIEFQTECQRKNIKTCDLICFLGISLMKQNQLNAAMVCFDSAIQQDPNYVIAYYNKGNLLSQQLKFEESLKYFDKVIQLDTQNSYAYNNKGEAVLQLNRNEEALMMFDQAILYDSNNELSYLFIQSQFIKIVYNILELIVLIMAGIIEIQQFHVRERIIWDTLLNKDNVLIDKITYPYGTGTQMCFYFWNDFMESKSYLFFLPQGLNYVNFQLVDDLQAQDQIKQKQFNIRIMGNKRYICRTDKSLC